MGLKKNDRVIFRGRLGTVASDITLHNTIENVNYAEVWLDGDSYITHIRTDQLEKLNEEGFDLEKLHNLDIYENIKPSIMFSKMMEEVKEVRQALINNDPINLAEELLDVMQTCLGVAAAKGIDLRQNIMDHNNKLLDRKHKFI